MTPPQTPEHDREIWFEKVGWSFMPCHIKGWAALLAIIVAVLAVVIPMQMIGDQTTHDWLDVVQVIAFVTGLVGLSRITARHS